MFKTLDQQRNEMITAQERLLHRLLGTGLAIILIGATMAGLFAMLS